MVKEKELDARRAAATDAKALSTGLTSVKDYAPRSSSSVRKLDGISHPDIMRSLRSFGA